MYVDRYPSPPKAGFEPKSFRSAYTGSTLSTNDTNLKCARNESSPSPSSPGMLQFDMVLDQTLSRVEELSLKSSPNHRYRQSRRIQSSPHSSDSGKSHSKLPIGRISNFFRGRAVRENFIPDLFGPGSSTLSEDSGDLAPYEVQITKRASSPRASNCHRTRGRSATKSRRRRRSTSVRQRPNRVEPAIPLKAKTPPRYQDSKSTCYPDVFVPPAPLDTVQSAVYAEFNSAKGEVTLSSTTIDCSSGSPRAACNHSLRISVTPKKSRSPRTPKKPPLAPCLFDSESASSVAVAMRAQNKGKTEPSRDTSLLDDSDDDDTSTVHILEVAHASHVFSVEDNQGTKSTPPPKLRMTTSTSSATAFLDDDMPDMPILQSRTTSSSVRTIEWKSYPKYYESDACSPSRCVSHNLPPLGRATSAESDKKPAAVSTPPVVVQGFLHNTPQALEVSPGHFVNLRGANETLLYVAADATSSRNMIATHTCVACQTTVHSVSDCEFVLCPVCHTILSTGIEGHGVGLGFLTSDWDEWNFDLLQVETAAECAPFAQMPL